MSERPRFRHSRRRVLHRCGAMVGLITLAGCNQRVSSRDRSSSSVNSPHPTTGATSNAAEQPQDTPEPVVQGDATVEWAVDVGAEPHPAVATNSIVVGDETGRVAAFARGDGALQWTHQFSSGPEVDIAGPPLVADGTAFTATRSGHAAAINVNSGETRWQTTTTGEVSDSPILHGDTLYLVGANGAVRALDPTRGGVRWAEQASAFAESFVRADPAITSGHMVLTIERAGLVTARRLTDWRPTWRLDVGSTTRSTATDGRVVIGTEAGVRAVDAMSGETIWEYEGPGPGRALSAIEGGVVCAVFDAGDLRLLDTATGTQRWQTRLDEAVFRQPLVADGTVYVATEDGGVHALTGETGETRWHGDFHAEPVVDVAGDVIAVGTSDGTVTVLREE